MSWARRVHVTRSWLLPRRSSSFPSVAWPLGLFLWYPTLRFRSPSSANTQFPLCESSPSSAPANFLRPSSRGLLQRVHPVPFSLPLRHNPFPFLHSPLLPHSVSSH